MYDQPIPMQCGCPYGPIGDHWPCPHGVCGMCDPDTLCMRYSVTAEDVIRYYTEDVKKWRSGHS